MGGLESNEASEVLQRETVECIHLLTAPGVDMTVNTFVSITTAKEAYYVRSSNKMIEWALTGFNLGHRGVYPIRILHSSFL